MIDEKEIIEKRIESEEKIVQKILDEFKKYNRALIIAGNEDEFGSEWEGIVDQQILHLMMDALQKGKELERDRQLLEGHEACNLAVVDKIGFIKEQASKIAELEKEYLHALECMDRICKRCQDNLERLRR